MAAQTSTLGLFGKWLIAPILVAGLGYFVVAPLVQHRPAEPATPKVVEPAVRASANPEVTIDRGPVVVARGPEVNFTVSAPRHRKRKRKPAKPVPVETPKPEVTTPPATEPPPDNGGSGGAATTTGGDGATTGTTGGDTSGTTTGDNKNDTTGTNG